jgi:predicted metal-dependent phosphoesterase TrpH
MGGFVDLHLHTTFSDGTLSPEEVVRRSADAGLSIISITDHDSVGGVPVGRETGKALGVEVIPGAELSADADGRDIHILAYFVDWEHPELVDCLRMYRDERRRRAERMVKKLNRMGVGIRLDQVLAKAGEGAIGRPHLADVMVEEEMVFSANEAFHKYLGYSKPAYEPKYSLSPSEAIRVIHKAGGLACMAHPGLYPRDDLIPGLVAEGLDGIEVLHYKHGPAEVARYSDTASRYGLLKTGGSDCHGDGRGEPILGSVEVPGGFVDDLREAHRRRGASAPGHPA